MRVGCGCECFYGMFGFYGVFDVRVFVLVGVVFGKDGIYR